MRKCLRCGEEMVESGHLSTADRYDPHVTVDSGKQGGLWHGQRPKIAICPKCGEISLYVNSNPREGYFF